MKDSTFQTWLAQKHARLVTPSELIADCVEEAVGSRPKHSHRVIKGQDHEVYDVVTTAGQKVIVRIAHQEDHRLEAEKWALDAARTKGVPTPRVLLLKRLNSSGTSVMMGIEEKLPGTPLDELLDAGVDATAVIPQIGEVLGRIHSVKTDGFGYLQPDGKGWDITWRSIMLDLVPKEQELLQAAQSQGVPAEIINKGLRLLLGHSSLYEWLQPVLNHGDFSPGHILVDKNRITGIIDMQQCSGNHPIFDFAQWAALGIKQVSASQLLESYPHKAAFGGSFNLLLNLALLRRSLWMLLVDSDQGNATGVEEAKNNLFRTVELLS